MRPRLVALGASVVAVGVGATLAYFALAPSRPGPAKPPGTTTAPRSTSTIAPSPSAASTTTPTTTAGGQAGRATWTVYHGDPAGSGVASTAVRFASPTHAWTSPVLDGEIYGEPLELAGRVYVATEDDTVYALAADTGDVVWSVQLGTPVPAGDLPCGNVRPTVGITGTPVIDPKRQEIFVVADELSGGMPSHHLVGIGVYTGRLLSDQVVDPPGALTADILQRTGHALDAGEVVFGFGGNDGDCGSYHGWVTAAPESGNGPLERDESDAASDERQGAVWMGGAAPEVTGDDDVWIAVGNGSVTSATGAHDDSDSVLELSSRLGVMSYFAPADWYSDNAHDRDLGSTAPALLADGDAVQVGKSQTAYLLRRAHLGGIGGQVAGTTVCTGADADGGDAVTGTVVYVPCRSGLESLQTSATSITVRWSAAARPYGPPIVAGGLVWSMGDGVLDGISPVTGATGVRLPIGTNANDFPTPAVADGLLLVTGGDDGRQVVAFSGSAGIPPAPSPVPVEP